MSAKRKMSTALKGASYYDNATCVPLARLRRCAPPYSQWIVARGTAVCTQHPLPAPGTSTLVDANMFDPFPNPKRALVGGAAYSFVDAVTRYPRQYHHPFPSPMLLSFPCRRQHSLPVPGYMHYLD
ncbi:hypothetical protein PG997_005615 [Apiospora hydei]|uniref:Uncharacterized protein n=1 Tax=Apiospora hydei TaxID=1337664 RepID=A0ABR1WLH2_9PEZI